MIAAHSGMAVNAAPELGANSRSGDLIRGLVLRVVATISRPDLWRRAAQAAEDDRKNVGLEVLHRAGAGGRLDLG